MVMKNECSEFSNLEGRNRKTLPEINAVIGLSLKSDRNVTGNDVMCWYAGLLCTVHKLELLQLIC